MMLDITNFPKDIESLQGIIAAQVKREAEQENRIRFLEEQIHLLMAKIYGKKSEKLTAEEIRDQLSLFNEGEAVLAEESVTAEEIIIPSHNRNKRGRKPIPEDLPRIEVIHDIPEEEKICQCGSALSRIGQEVSEKLDIIPAKIRVLRQIRYKYACKSCEGVESDKKTVLIADAPAEIIPKGMASSGMIAHIVVSKFVDGLPFYRQVKQLSRIGVDIPRATMAGWTIYTANRCDPLFTLLHQVLLSGPLINIDETTVQVLDEPGRANTSKSYMWVIRGGPIDYPIILYHYHPSRSAEVPINFLKGYKGYIQADGFSGYDSVGQQPGVTLVGCWAHARRKFVEVLKACTNKDKKESKAAIALHYIGKLYAIEKTAKQEGLSFEEIYRLRQEKSKPLLEEFKVWLNQVYDQTPPKGLLGKAIGYTLNQWHKLIRYIEDGRLRPDNNLAENAIRPFVVGRKNWLFSGNPRGAKASAVLYSMIETAKANNIEPYQYLRFIFDRIPLAKSAEDYKQLLPQFINRDLLQRDLT